MPSRPSQAARELRDLDGESSPASEGEDDDVGEINAPGPSRKKRKRISEIELEEVFENMDPERKAQLTKDYRKLQMEAEDLKTNQANTTIAELNLALKRGSKLFQEVRDTSLASLDARLMLTTSDTAVNISRKMAAEGNAFNVDEYLIRVKGLLGLDRDEIEDQDESDEDDELESADDRLARRRRMARQGALGDWEKIGWMAAKLSRRVAGVEFMFGPINVEAKKRTMKPRQRYKLAEETRPEEIRAGNAATQARKEEDTMANVRLIKRVLEHNDPTGEGTPFFPFVVNPHSYGQTVENCFFVSFLVRDGHAGVEVQPNGHILLKLASPYDPEEGGEEPAKNQAVVELTLDDWKLAKELYDIQECTIPHRKYVEEQTLTRNGWYT